MSHDPRHLQSIVIHSSETSYGCSYLNRLLYKCGGWSDMPFNYVILNGYPYAWSVDPMPVEDSLYERTINDAYLAPLDGSIEAGLYPRSNALMMDNQQEAVAFGYRPDTISICLVGPCCLANDSQYPWAMGYSKAQIKSLLTLCVTLMKRHRIPVENVVEFAETNAGLTIEKPSFIGMSGFRKLLEAWMAK